MAAFPVSGDLRVRVFVNDNGAEKYLTFNASSVTFEAGKRYTKTLALDMSQAKDASIMDETIDKTAKTATINTCVNHDNCTGSSHYSGGMVASTISNAAAVLTACINEGSFGAGGIAYSLSKYSIAETKELYFVNNVGLFVVQSDGQDWNTKGPSQISDLNKQETIDSLNAAIAEWNINNPDYTSPYKFAAGGDDNTIPKLVPIE